MIEIKNMFEVILIKNAIEKEIARLRAMDDREKKVYTKELETLIKIRDRIIKKYSN